MTKKRSTLQRPRQPMPALVRTALDQHELWDAYRARPASQQNDYLMWINQAVRPETKAKRLAQMLGELKQGGLYMNMAHPASKKP